MDSPFACLWVFSRRGFGIAHPLVDDGSAGNRLPHSSPSPNPVLTFLTSRVSQVDQASSFPQRCDRPPRAPRCPNGYRGRLAFGRGVPREHRTDPTIGIHLQQRITRSTMPDSGPTPARTIPRLFHPAGFGKWARSMSCSTNGVVVGSL